MGSRREVLKSMEVVASTNAGLWLEKGLTEIEEKGPGRQSLFEQLVGIGVPDDYRRFFQRWRAALEEQQPGTQTEEVTVAGRMVVGLGAESVLEASIGLHRTYGVPYIPGSALKGLAAAAAHKKLKDPKWRKVSEDGKVGAAHKILFGDQESSGYVTFYDALWVPTGDKLPLDLDVMTVHHRDYYQGSDCPPADWDNPTPVAFLSARGTYLLAATGPAEWVEAAMEILKEALEKDGIGAKTAAGYGRMKIDRPPEPATPSLELLKQLKIGNADNLVPRILGPLKGEQRRQGAAAIIAKLDRKALKKRTEMEWVKLLLEAEGKLADPSTS